MKARRLPPLLFKYVPIETVLANRNQQQHPILDEIYLATTIQILFVFIFTSLTLITKLTYTPNFAAPNFTFGSTLVILYAHNP